MFLDRGLFSALCLHCALFDNLVKGFLVKIIYVAMRLEDQLYCKFEIVTPQNTRIQLSKPCSSYIILHQI